jgi:anaerobic selenocysteine-containing dehydrogenase
VANLSRREFLRLTAGGGSTAVAVGLGVKRPENLIPYVVPPEEIRPSVITWIATTCRECPAGCGMHLAHRDGRVTKAEGNPDHPVSRGALCPRGQSALQGLYDPDRVRRPVYRPRGGEPQAAEWPKAIAEIGRRLAAAKGRAVLVSDLQTGALAEVMQAFAARTGSAVFYEPFNYEPLREVPEAAALALGAGVANPIDAACVPVKV